jgi:hypothetical protein
VLDRAATATPFVSAALVWHAARGECVPELAALLTALQDASPTTLAWAGIGVRRLGHTSGAGLLHGVAAALKAGTEATP